MKRLDMVVLLALVLLSGAQAADARYFSYPQWENLTEGEQLTAASMAVLAAAYAAEKIQYLYPDLEGVRGWVPYWMNNQDGVWLVDAVYGIERYRSVPYIDILLRPDYWFEVLGIRNIRR